MEKLEGKLLRCINPTATITKGCLYKVIKHRFKEFPIDKQEIFTYNDKGFPIQVRLDRFDITTMKKELFIKEVKEMRVYKLKINYHNLQGDHPKGQYWLKSNRTLYYPVESDNPLDSLPIDFVENNPDMFEECSKEYNLIQEAIRRGYGEDVIVKFVWREKSNECTLGKTSPNSPKWAFNSADDNCLRYKNTRIYYKGQWAEIVKKDPLFITEDGVEVFEYTQLFCVNEIDLYISENKLNPDHRKYKGIYTDTGSRSLIMDSPKIKKFSTKEKAQEYIDLNKPKYTKQDIIDAITNFTNEQFNAKKLSDETCIILDGLLEKRLKGIINELDKNN